MERGMGIEQYFEHLFEPIKAFALANKSWAPLIVMVLAFGESLAFVSLVLPFWGILVVIGAAFGSVGSFDFWVILSAAAIGAALGDWLSYWLGFHYHAQIAQMWPLKNYPELLPKGEAFFKKWGAWAIVFGRFSGPMRASVPIVAGALRMPTGVFQIANWSSAFVWAFSLMVLGDSMFKVFSLIKAKFGV